MVVVWSLYCCYWVVYSLLQANRDIGPRGQQGQLLFMITIHILSCGCHRQHTILNHMKGAGFM